MSDRTAALNGTQKAALVLMQMSQDRAAEVMRQFTESEAEEITAEIVRLRRVDVETAEAALTEFHERALSGRRQARGGRDVAAGLLEASFGSERAAGLLDRLTSTMAGNPFEFLEAAEPTQVSTLLDGELPETIALVLAHLPAPHASAVLTRVDPELRADVAQSIATMGSASPDAVAVVADTLRHRARAIVVPRENLDVVGGVQPLVDIINRADAATERELLAALDARDPALADEVRSRMLTFADIVRLESRDVQQVLRGIDAAVLAVALKGAAEQVVQAVRGNMSERNRELLDEEISMLGPVRKAEVDDARGAVVRAIRELEATGAITVQRGDEDEYVA
ncbi:flagellar motor switch protein FliG [Diaminobutyricimonas aerilata]|uniref:Flagellar motor switch protein FliG n=1 Tax=Diaminobutyricimonas aerilata TaxID=1162967 RepID=A0A2M9CN06_9MICO|nr:flagellar motor switch protein FliG [Diaminobutyricimonas aerilata]PJJ73289.1 flagellar motor switch protein FliG [Diaminobutyricimonas aerilata]